MITNDLVAMLARGEIAAQPRAAARAFTAAAALGALAAIGLMVVFLGVRADLPQAVARPMFWAKLGFAVSIAASAVLLVWRAGVPGRRAGVAAWGVIAPVALMWAAAAVTLATAEAPARTELLMGSTWQWCPFLIAGLALPPFAAGAWALRSMLAPVRPLYAGAALGLAAGAIGATAYSMHCPELAAPFIAVWYVVGILIPTAIGALSGPALFRW